MNSEPLISVVMPVYNESIQELHGSIKSILNQTYKYFEFIIIDDNPNNLNIKKYIKNQAMLDNRIKLVFNAKNIGVIESENKGIELSKGTYIARIDADDISVKNRLESQIRFLMFNKLDVISSNFSLINIKGELTRKYSFSGITQTNQIKIRKAMSHFSLAIGPTLFFKRNVFVKLNGYRYTNVEDYDFVVRALILGFRFGYQSSSLVLKRLRKTSISYNTLLSQYIIIRTISHWIRKYGYSKILPIINLKREIDHINNKELKHFKYYARARYTFNDDKNIINLLNVIFSIIKSKIVLTRCLWSLFVNKRQDKFLK